MVFDMDLDSKDLRELFEGFFFNASERWCLGLSRLGARANAMVSHLIDAVKFLLNAFGQFKGIGTVAQPLEFFGLGPIRLGAV